MSILNKYTEGVANDEAHLFFFYKVFEIKNLCTELEKNNRFINR